MANTLFLDTTHAKKILVKLVHGKKTIVIEEERSYSSQIILQTIDRLLKKEGMTIQDIEKIEVSPGPGSYTGIRVGLSIANALSYALLIPVNDSQSGIFSTPTY